jgi:hypothetical protein
MRVRPPITLYEPSKRARTDYRIGLRLDRQVYARGGTFLSL